MSRLKIKQIRREELHLDFIKLLVCAAETPVKNVSQIVIKEDTMLYKDLKGRYFKNFSLKDLETKLGL